MRKQSGRDDPIVLEEVTERIADGDEFNIAAEYGNKLSSTTIRKLSRQSFRNKLPEIKTVFNDTALEWLGEAANKNHANKYGYNSPASLWTRFLNSTDADEKMDVSRLREEATEFFKKVVLEHGWFGRDINTIYGLQGAVMKKYDDAVPKKGTEGYDVAISHLKEEYPNKKGAFSSEEIAKAYRAKTGQKKEDNK